MKEQFLCSYVFFQSNLNRFLLNKFFSNGFMADLFNEFRLIGYLLWMASVELHAFLQATLL